MKLNQLRFIVGLVFLWSSHLFSQDLMVEKFRLFEEKEDVVVKTFLVDQQNFIWFITNNRLYRFDGSESLDMSDAFEKYQIKAPNSIFLSTDFKIWITGINTIGYIDLIEWTYTPLDLKGVSLNNAVTRMIYETSNGAIVFAYGNGQLVFKTKDALLVNNDIYNSSMKKQIRIGITSIAEFKGKLFASTSEGQLLEINQENYMFNKITQVTDQLGIEIIIPLKDELLFELNNEGFYYYDFKRLKKEDRISYQKNVHLIKDSPLHMFYVDNEHLYMLDKSNDEYPIYHETLSRPLETLSQIQLTQTHVLLSNVEGIFSISVKNNGVYFMNPNPNFQKNSVRGTYFFEDGSQFYCSYNGAGYIDPNGNLTHFDEHRISYRILPINKDRLLLSSEGSFLQIFDRSTMTVTPFEYSSKLKTKLLRENSYVTALAEDEAFYYTGSYGGMLKVNKKTNEVLKVECHNKDLSFGIGIRDLSTADNQLLASTTSGLYKLENAQWDKIYPIDDSETIHSHIKRNDTIWMATQSSGLVAVDDQGMLLEHYSTKEGLTDQLVYQLALCEDKIFAFTAYGFNLYYDHAIIPYYPKSKEENSEYNHGAIGYDIKNNQLYAGGLNGYTTIDLNGDFAEIKFPSYVLSEVITANKTNESSIAYNTSYNDVKTIKIPKESPYVRLKFKQNELDVTTVKYEYLIPALFDEWRRLDIGKSIELVGISPGTYELKIRYPGEKNFNKILIEKEYYFYQQWWFYLVMMLVFLGLGFTYFKFRVNLIRKNERLRSRIAADLHDDIGSVLGGILAQSQYASLAPEKTESILNRIKFNAKNGLQSLSDIVWSVDYKNDNWKSFLSKLEVHGNESTQNSALNFNFNVIGSPIKNKLDQKLRQNLWLIFKESLMNCIKHAAATEFTLEIKFNKQHVELVISDNGKGFKELDAQVGNGLKNMKMRSELINAVFNITSEPGNTVITIKV